MMAILVKAEPVKPADLMRGVELDDFAAAWARRLGLARGTFERDLVEADAGDLAAHHDRHHHARPRGCFGVTTRFWDRLFGTL